MAAKWWTLVAVCTGVFMLLLDITIVNVALPDIQRDLDASLSDLQWVIDAYALTLAALLLTAGSLADRYGRRLLFAIGTLVFTVGSLLCGLAPTVEFLSIARAAQGVGGAIMFATALALLSGAFSGRERGTAFAYFGATTGAAVAVGPVLGGVLTSGLSWHWIFWVNIPICFFALAVTLTKVVETRDPHPGRLDWIGFLTFSSGLGLLVLALIRAGSDGWGDSVVVGSFVASGVLLVAFVVSQALQEQPMFDLGLLRKPTFVGGLIAAFGVSASVFSLLTYLVIYVQNVLGYSPVQAGVRFLCLSGMSFVSAIVAGRLTSHVPTKWLIAPGFLVTALGLFLLTGLTVDSEWTHLVPGLVGVRPRHRADQRPAGLHRGGRGPSGAGRDGLGRQLDVPSGRHRHRHRRAGLDLQPPGGRRHQQRPRRYAGRGSCRAGRRRRHQRADQRRPGPGARRGPGHARSGGDVELRGRAEPHHHDRDGDRAGLGSALPAADPGQGLRAPGRSAGR